MNRNHWITFSDEPVAEWDAYFPAPRDDPERLVRFACLLVDAGKRHAVWSSRRYTTATYEAHVREALDNRRHLQLSVKALDPELPSIARLAFYRDDQIVEEDVGDVGDLLESLRPELSRKVIDNAPPVTVLGFSVPVTHPDEVHFRIYLETDIWFPRVVGMGDRYLMIDDEADCTDNRALAARHTPRFNAFLRELREATVTSGGRWEIVRLEGFPENYRDQWDETGIAI